jgi:aconitate hydratase
VVGGIEAEAAMLGQPVSMLIPRVVGFKLSGELPEGATATDLVLTITEMLREHGVVGKFVEFYGTGVGAVPLANRATIGNMSPEYGSTAAIFPIDEETVRYLRFTGRDDAQVALVEAYAREQGLWHDPAAEPAYSERLELDLSTIVPSLAGPKRPQDRVALADAKAGFRAALGHYVRPDIEDRGGVEGTADEASAESFPASDPPANTGDEEADRPHAPEVGDGRDGRPQRQSPITLADGMGFEIDHGAVVIASITSCTNTSNPSVMIGAALLAKNAVGRALSRKPWVKTSLAPGSKVVMDYYERAGLIQYLEKLGFHLVGYGCTTCIGNSGPIIDEVSAAVGANDLAVVSVHSGNRNFEGRINPDVKMNYLASPPLVVAYALAGTMDLDLTTEPLGDDADGRPVYLRDIWPTAQEIEHVVDGAIASEMFTRDYADVFTGDERWRDLSGPTTDTFEWDEGSTYGRKPPYFDGMAREPSPVRDVTGARVLARLGDSVTTDHISPAGAIKTDSPAGAYLAEHGVERRDFNSYGSRRGNHQVMIRGTFANIRLRNQLAPGTEGAWHRRWIYPQLPRRRRDHDDLRRVDGLPSRRRAAGDPGRQGVRVRVVTRLGSQGDSAARSASGYRRVLRADPPVEPHRRGRAAVAICRWGNRGLARLTGEEEFAIVGVEALNDGTTPREVVVRAGDIEFQARLRIDTPGEADYFRHGGIMQYVLRSLLD